MNLAGTILKAFGWKVNITVPDYDKCLICVAPHTSNWDFVLGELAYISVGRRAGFLMKETWFFPPLGWFFRGIGGIPVPRKHGSSLTQVIIDKFRQAGHMQLAVTPEGTRSRVCRWRTGFLHISREAGVPIVLAIIDYGHHTIIADTVFTPTGDADADMAAIKAYYRAAAPQGKHPELFCCDDQGE